MEKTKCAAEYENGCLTVRITGEIDHHTARVLRVDIDRAVYLYRAPKVVMEMSGVSFMDSAGLGLILGRYSVIRELGGRLCLRGVSPEVEKILKLAGTDKLVSVMAKA